MRYTIKVLFWMIVLTAPSVLYVHGQVALFRVSYDLNIKADELKDKSESYRRLKFEVDQLKAPRLLEEKMKELKLELEFPRDIEVIRVEPSQPLTQALEMSNLTEQSAITGKFDLLGRIIKVAQAKMED